MVIRRENKMANYYASIRTNYFRVKDEKKFREFMAHVSGTEDRVELWEEKDKNGNTVFGFGTLGGIAGVTDYHNNSEDDGEDEDSEADFDAFLDSLQTFVADDDAIIILESGHEKIWESISGTVQSADLAFANIEAPVSKDLPYSSFPNFNMHPEYPEAAVSAGFNVFSLVNNHTNDQGLEGMRATAKWAETVHTQTQNAENGRTVYFSGLKKTPEEKFSSCIIKKDGWTVLFLAVTEILNRPDFKTYMNYVPYTQKGRESLTAFVSALRKENPCDIFVLSVHTDETEYVPGVAEKRRNYYYTLLESGVDVIWANHPHIIREREIIGNERTGNLEKLIMYGNGNTISGQRWQPELDNPLNDRENTGDGLLFEVTFSRKHGTESEKNVIIKETNPCYISPHHHLK